MLVLNELQPGRRLTFSKAHTHNSHTKHACELGLHLYRLNSCCVSLRCLIYLWRFKVINIYCYFNCLLLNKPVYSNTEVFMLSIDTPTAPTLQNSAHDNATSTQFAELDTSWRHVSCELRRTKVLHTASQWLTCWEHRSPFCNTDVRVDLQMIGHGPTWSPR